MSTWLEKHLAETIAALAGSPLLAKGIQAIWQRFRIISTEEYVRLIFELNQKDTEIATHEAEKKALMLELIAQYKLSSKLQGKYGVDSTPPQS